jgi:hypothetical protein
MLATIYATFEEGLDFPDLRAARAALDPVGEVKAAQC